MVIFNFKMHVYFGLAIWIYLFGVADMFWLNPIPLLVGAVFPDTDHPKAPLSRLIPLWRWFTHRGKVHSLQFAGLTSILVGIIFGSEWALSFFIGYFIHLATDSITPMGIKWW